MKRILALLLALSMIFVLCACGGNSSKKSSFDAEEALKSKIQADVAVYCKFNYSNVKNAMVSITTISNSGNDYTAKGKVTIIDDYGDKYVGKVDAEYTLNGESFTKNSLNISTPVKQ